MTIAGNECFVYNIEGKDTNPIKILDIQSSHLIKTCCLHQIDKNMHLASINTEAKQLVYFIKTKEGKSSSKIKKVDCEITLKESSHQIIYQQIQSDNQVLTVFGNSMQLFSKQSQIISDDGKINKSVILELPSIEQQTNTRNAQSTNEVVVQSYDDRQQIQPQLVVPLFDVNSLSLTDLSSRKTSTSTAVQGGSLSTILRQALVSEDKEQMEWVFSQNDPGLIDRTLKEIKESKIQKNLMRKLFEMFHSNQSVAQTRNLTIWLQVSIRTFWKSFIINNQEFIGELQAIREIVQVKTRHLDQMMELQGKL